MSSRRRLALSHGKPLLSPTRWKANRRSPASPCHPRNADSVAVPAMDLNGYRTISQTRPTRIIAMPLYVSPRRESVPSGTLPLAAVGLRVSNSLDDSDLALGSSFEYGAHLPVFRTLVHGNRSGDAGEFDHDAALRTCGFVHSRGTSPSEESTSMCLENRRSLLCVAGERLGVRDGTVRRDPITFSH